MTFLKLLKRKPRQPSRCPRHSDKAVEYANTKAKAEAGNKRDGKSLYTLG